MANLKEIRNRITSVKSTMQITSAMKMVSAAKLKKAQDAITAMRPYSNKLTELLQSLSSSLEGDSGSVYAQVRPVSKILIVAITSNRGLCGAFNSNILKQCKNLKAKHSDKELHFLPIGKKASEGLPSGYHLLDNHNAIFDDLNFDKVAEIANELMGYYETGLYDQIFLVYNSFKNAATQIVMTEPYLPIQAEVNKETDTGKTNDYIYEPSKEEIVAQLIPKSLKTQLFKAIRDSFASEHGARMTAMHKATDNAGELRDQLTLTYNKARQAAITNEILEIVGGAEALNN